MYDFQNYRVPYISLKYEFSDLSSPTEQNIYKKNYLQSLLFNIGKLQIICSNVLPIVALLILRVRQSKSNKLYLVISTLVSLYKFVNMSFGCHTVMALDDDNCMIDHKPQLTLFRAYKCDIIQLFSSYATLKVRACTLAYTLFNFVQ